MKRLLVALLIGVSLVVAACERRSPTPPGPGSTPQPKVLPAQPVH